MTTPDERYRALQNAEDFLVLLCVPQKTPKVPKSIREAARAILRHYPSGYELEQIAAMTTLLRNSDKKRP